MECPEGGGGSARGHTSRWWMDEHLPQIRDYADRCFTMTSYAQKTGNSQGMLPQLSTAAVIRRRRGTRSVSNISASERHAFDSSTTSDLTSSSLKTSSGDDNAHEASRGARRAGVSFSTSTPTMLTVADEGEMADNSNAGTLEGIVPVQSTIQGNAASKTGKAVSSENSSIDRGQEDEV